MPSLPEIESHFEKKLRSRSRVALCVVVAILGVTSSLVFWRVLVDSERINANRLTSFAVQVIASDTMEDFKEEFGAMQRMSRVWALQPLPSEVQRRSFATAFLEQNPGLVSLEYVDSSYRVREVVETEGGHDQEAQLNRDLTRDDLLGKGLQEALKRRERMVIPGQTTNGKIYHYIVVPIQRDEEFRGFIVVKLDVQKALASILTTVSGLGYGIVVKEDGREIYSTGWADRSLASEWGQQTGLRLAGGTWTIQAIPESVIFSSFKTPLPKIALGLGLTVTGLVVMLLAFSHVISQRSRQIESTNAELRHAIELRKLSEDALRESEMRFSGILAMSTDGIVSTDENQVVTLFNSGAEAMFGYSASEVIGKKLDMLIPVRFQRSHVEQVRRFGAEEDHCRRMSPVRQIAGVRKDGTEFPLEASSSKLTLNGEKIYTAIVRDVTERHRGEELLRQLHLELEQRVLDRTAELEDANQALQGEIQVRTRAEAMLRQLSGRLLQLQDEERRRVARELHDSTGQYLVALALNISSINTAARDFAPEIKTQLADALELVDQCSSEIRTMSYLLHPPLLDELGLVPALEWYAAGFKKRSGIATKLEMPPDRVRIPADFERTLFRIVQECLSNVHRHSGATEVKIRLMLNEDEIRMGISDNGRGFAGSEHFYMTDDVVALLGVGIAGMRERVSQLGGRLEIYSSDEGTTVTTVLAVPQGERSATSS